MASRLKSENQDFIKIIAPSMYYYRVGNKTKKGWEVIRFKLKNDELIGNGNVCKYLPTRQDAREWVWLKNEC